MNNISGALFSEDKKYRYKLWRTWDTTRPVAMCIGLNPSTANEFKTDPTITHLKAMLDRLGYGGLIMTNLFAYVSSKPKVLLEVEDAIGDNDKHLTEVRKICHAVIFCWGGFPQAKSRVEVIKKLFPEALCFGLTFGGAPYHPLALMYAGETKTAQLIAYNISNT